MRKRKETVEHAVTNMVDAIRGYHEMRERTEAAESALASERAARDVEIYRTGVQSQRGDQWQARALAAEATIERIKQVSNSLPVGEGLSRVDAILSSHEYVAEQGQK